MQPQPPASRPGFDFAALSLGTKILLVGALLFLIDSFLPWQRACAGAFCASANAWSGNGSFAGIIASLLAIALLAWEGIQATGTNLNLNLTVPASRISAFIAAGVILFGVIKFLLVVGTFGSYGAWIGLVILLALAYGAWLKFSEPATTSSPGPSAGPPAGPPTGGGFSG
jgi:hypothetical protein